MTEELVLRGAVRRFGTVAAVAGVDVSISQGEVVGLLGHNGAGKTTIVRLLAGLLAPDEGVVRVGGLDPVADGSVVRRRMGVLPAAPVSDGRMTARANLRFAAEMFGVPAGEVDQRVAAGLAAFDLQDRAEEPAAGFSTGMRQRLALARVLLPEPEVLLLDEPTGALDPVAARQVRQLVADLARREDRTVLLCTHDLAEAEQLCDRVVVLQHGRVVAAGTPAELTARQGVGSLLVEVAPAAADRAAVVIGRDGGEVSAEGAGQLAVTGIGRDQVPGLVAALVAAEVPVLEVRRRRPTLEDVYLALHDAARTEEVDR